jgi:polyisoprenoid-binding protein YceI
MTKIIPLAIAGAAALLLALPLTAQTAPSLPGSPDVAAITGGSYTVDRSHTLVQWTVDHFGFSPYFGLFGDINGTLELDPKNPAAAKVDVTIPVAKVATANPALTAHLLKPAAAGAKADFFGADPAAARFVSTKVEPGANNTAKITGDLTLNGVTKPVVLETHFYGAGKAPAMMGGKENVGFTAKTKIMRSEFGIGYAIPFVSDEVSLKIAVAFVK